MRNRLFFPILLCFFLSNSNLKENQIHAQGNPDPAYNNDSAANNELRLILPDVIYAVPGIETNVYFENVVQVINRANYVFDIYCTVGHTQNERWTITPKDHEVGEYSFELVILNQKNQVVGRQKSKLRITPYEAGVGKRISFLMMGDSLTHASTYPEHVLKLSKDTKGLELKLIGSHDPSEKGILHEGYGGWTAVRFVTHFTETARTGNYRKRGSPFLYRDQPDEKPKLDFARYCKEYNDSKPPDFVTIFLGPNDVYRCTDQTIDQTVDTVIKHLDILIKMIHSHSAETNIGLMLPVPASASQDAFGTSSGRRQTRWQYKRNQHQLVESMLSHYRTSKLVSIVPTHLNIDTVHNYPMKEMLSNSQTEVKIFRQYNAVHPASTGYRQIGDSVFCWMKARLAETEKKK